MWVRIPIVTFQENPELVENLKQHRYEKKDVIQLKEWLTPKKRLYLILMLVVTLAAFFGSISTYCLDEYLGITVPYGGAISVISYLLFFPDILIINKFIVYHRLMDALKTGYPFL